MSLKEENAQLKSELEAVKTQAAETKKKMMDLFSAQITNSMGASDKEKKKTKSKQGKERKVWIAVVVALTCVALYFRFNK